MINRLYVIEKILNDIHNEFRESNYGDYDVSLCYERQLLESFITEMSLQNGYDESKENEYLDMFLGLRNDFKGEKKEAIEFFIELIMGRKTLNDKI